MSTVSTEAAALHRASLVFDLHADTPKLMELGYDVGNRHRTPPKFLRYASHLDLPRAEEGNLGAQFFGMWSAPLPGSSRAIHTQIDALEAAVKKHPGRMASVRSADELRAARAAGQLASLLGIEGGHAPDGRLENAELFARRGVRYLGLLHFSANEIGAPAKGVGRDEARGLSGFGRDVVRECDRTGIIVDLAHINRRGFFEVLEVATKPLYVSHTGVLGVKEHWRNIDDEQIRAVAQRGGAVGVIFAPRFLGGPGIESVVDHILHIRNVAGDDVAALGSDFDGFVKPPDGLGDVAALPNLTEALLRRGVPEVAIRKILGENALRVLADVPPGGAG